MPTTISDPGFGVGTNNRTVTLRREVFFAEKSGSKDFGIDSFTNDTVFGSSQRSSVLRFDNASVKVELDGSVTVTPNLSPGFSGHQQGLITASGARVGVAQDALSENGVLEGIFYQQTLALDTPASGTNGVNHDGQFYEMQGGGALGEYGGFVTRESQILVEHGFRLVIKFTNRFNPLINNQQLYVGLCGQAGGSLLLDALTIPAAAGRDYIGLRMTGAPGVATWEFFIRNSVTATEQAVDTGVVYNARTRFLVIETTRTGFGTAGATATQVKLAMYDSEMQLLANTLFTSAALIPSDRRLEVAMGSYNPDGLGLLRYISPYYVTLVNRTDLAAPVT